MIIDSGSLNKRITIQKVTRMDDLQGGYATTYTNRTKAWAQIRAITARATDQYEQMTPEILHRIIIRYRSDVKVTDRVLVGTRVFELLGPPINVDEQGAYLQLECREVVSDAN